MDRSGIVNAGLDGTCRECLLQLPSAPAPNGIDVVDVAYVRFRVRRRNSTVGQKRIVARGGATPSLGPGLEVPQLDPQHRALHPFEPVFVTLEHVLVLSLGAPVTEHSNGARVGRVSSS